LFVTGTGTGVGKTIVSAALLAAMRAAGEPVRAHKPVVTGLDEQSAEWPPDHELLAAAAGMDPYEVAPLRYGPAVSPHLAAALAGESTDPVVLVANARAAGSNVAWDSEESRGTTVPEQPERAARDGTLVVEGVGGLLVPLADDFTVRDLAAELALPVIVVASPGLGTINHTLLTLQAARRAALDVRAVVLTPWPAAPSPMERSNRETIARLGEIEVAVLGEIANPDIAELAHAGSRLPWQCWLSRTSFVPS
jgi:dethiobiotin synthetase